MKENLKNLIILCLGESNKTIIPFIMRQCLVRDYYFTVDLHISSIHLESVHAISSIADGTVNLNNLGKFPEFKTRLLLVFPFLKTYIIRSRGSMFLFFLSPFFFIAPVFGIPLSYSICCYYFNAPKNLPSEIFTVIH